MAQAVDVQPFHAEHGKCIADRPSTIQGPWVSRSDSADV
jgi:hypothetical protein